MRATVIHVGPQFNSTVMDIVQSGMVLDSHCLKRKVVAVVCDANDEFLGIGWNGDPDMDPESCPRMEMASGERYDLCDQNCPGQKHAEIDAMEDCEGVPLGEAFDGSDVVMYVYGHDHICRECAELVGEWGCGTIMLIREPDEDGIVPDEDED